MTTPVHRFNPKGRYTDNDESLRRRAREIQQLERAYKTGAAYSDISSAVPNAVRDYEMFRRVRRKPSVNYPLPK